MVRFYPPLIVLNKACAVGRSASVGAAAIITGRSWRQHSEYFQVVRDSQKQWWDEHPDYQKQHRQQNPQLVESNRQRQRLRDRKRRVELLVRNNLALDLKHSASEVWLLGPQVRDLDRNNLASAQVLILPSVGHSPADRRPS
jgi:hypothetical protein